MTLLTPPPSPLDDVCVALDLETTGLDSERDEIIEIGATKFLGDEVLETFETLVNPGRTLSEFITQFTGISQYQVDRAPSFSAVAADLMTFIGQRPLVGHSLSFDMAFLAQAGLHLNNQQYDTLELASVFLPGAREYSLSGLARALAISFNRPHRALEDTRICHQLFVALVKSSLVADPDMLAGMSAIAARSQWSLRGLIRQLSDLTAGRRVLHRNSVRSEIPGLDMCGLRGRLTRPEPLHGQQRFKEVDEHEVTSLLQEGGAMSKAFPKFEYRAEQVQMARAVTDAFNTERHLMVEAGTGVGKSIAYLLPAMLFAARNGERVVVSTNTINLQEQLVSRDIPSLVSVLSEAEPGFRPDELQFTHLKGRANYLCFRRWADLVQGANLPAQDARMASKTLMWLQDTATGDRAEINIPGRENYLWDKLSALGAEECHGNDGVCFLRTARARAEGAHVVVVNHALLLSDMASGAGVIPPYNYLIIDEAHHLEEEASRQFGYEVPRQAVDNLTVWLGQQVQRVRISIRGDAVDASRRERVITVADEVAITITRLREAWDQLMSNVATFVEHHQPTNEQGNQLGITRSSRKQPGWSSLEVQWEQFNETSVELARLVDRLLIGLEPLDAAALRNPILELKNWQHKAEEIREQVEQFVINPNERYVYWVTLRGQERMPTLSASPLDVGSKLEESLFSRKKCVVLTSATLSVQGSMQYVKDRVGLASNDELDELIVGSPFEYQKSALLLIPSVMPEPADVSYKRAVDDALIRVARASHGGVLALFTSHVALRAARRGIKVALEADGIKVLAQGVDGSPGQIVRAAIADGNAVLLGTSSLWEGVDMPGDLLRVVVLARLPFSVPTDPVFVARSKQFVDPFHQYVVPEAVLRFRQGFGRLIRSKSDRGVVVILDQRIISKPYGNMFLRSIPACTILQVTMQGLEEEIAGWLRAG